MHILDLRTATKTLGLGDVVEVAPQVAADVEVVGGEMLQIIVADGRRQTRARRLLQKERKPAQLFPRLQSQLRQQKRPWTTTQRSASFARRPYSTPQSHHATTERATSVRSE